MAVPENTLRICFSGVLLACLALSSCSSGGTEPEPAAPGSAASEEQKSAQGPLKLGGREVTITQLPPGVRHLSEIRPRALSVLDTVIEREASKPGNAWALAHGVLAKGADFSANDGRRAVSVLVDDFLKAERIPKAQGMHPYFPKKVGEVRVEPHTDLILKTFIEVGLPLDEPLTDRVGAPTLERLLRGSRLRFTPAATPSGGYFSEPDDIAWSTQAWCQAVDKGAAPTWRNAGGHRLDIDTVAMEQLKLLELEYHFIQRARVSGETIKKRRQHIFAHACGGAHLFQGVEACAAVGFPNDQNLRSRMAQLIDAYLWRVPFEIGLIDQAVRGAPRLIPILVNQDIKFLGHALEALGKAERDEIWRPTAEQVELLERMEQRLLMHVLQLESIQVYDAAKMASLFAREHGFQFYLDLVGDACHAFAGLKLQEELKALRTDDLQQQD